MFISIDDYNIYYEEQGESNNDFDCLLIHGWGTNAQSLRFIRNILSKKYRTISIDLLGFGQSDDLKRSFNVSDYVEIVAKLIHKLNIKNVCLVGHSYGGRIIIKMNNKNDLLFNIKQNVLIDSAGIKHKKKKNIKSYIYSFLKNFYMLLPLQNDIREKKIEELKNKFGSSDYRNAPHFLRDTLVKSVNEDLSGYVKNINVKTLIIWGENDKDTPIEDGLFIKNNIKNSEIHIVKNAAHFPFNDSPFEVEKILTDYFNI